MEKHQSSFENIVLYSTFIDGEFHGTLQHGNHTIAHGHLQLYTEGEALPAILYISTFGPRLVT